MATKETSVEGILTREQCDKFLELVREHKTVFEIAQELHYSKARIQDFITWLKINGPERFIDAFVHDRFKKYTPYEMACIVETKIAFNLTISQVCAAFQTKEYFIQKMLNERKAKGHPLLSAIPLELPQTQRHEFTGTYQRNNWKRIADHASLGYDPERLDCQNLPLDFKGRPDLAADDDSLDAGVSYTLPAERNTMPSDSREITGIERNDEGYNSKGEFVGKSTLRFQHCRGQRRRGHESNKDDARPASADFNAEEYRISQLCKGISIDDKDALEHAIDEVCGIMHARGERDAAELNDQAAAALQDAIEASERCLKDVMERQKGISAAEVDVNAWDNVGRKPDINVNSDGFDDLPVRIQLEAYKTAYRRMTHQVAVKDMLIQELEKKNLQGREAELTNEERYIIASGYIRVTEQPVSDVACSAGLSRRQYYHYQEVMTDGKRADHKHDRIKASIRVLFEVSGGTIGPGRITYNLPDYCNVAPGYDLVVRLMKEMNLSPGKTRRKTKINTYSGESSTAAKNITHRASKADSPATLVAGDITQIDVVVNRHKVKLFASAFKDFGTEKVLSYSISSRTPVSFVSNHYKDMVDEHFQHCGTKIVHTDRGVHYMAEPFANISEDSGVTRSMSNKGSSLDNGKLEQLWAAMKKTALDGRVFDNIESVLTSLASYFEMVNSGFFRPVKSVYGTDYPRPVLKKSQSVEDFQKEMDRWKRGNKVVHMISKGHGADNVRCPPSKNHLFCQVVDEIMEKNLDLTPSKAFEYARARYNKLAASYDKQIKKERKRMQKGG